MLALSRSGVPASQWKGAKRGRIGISAFEDKLVCAPLREALEAVSEQDFVDCSHSFRPGRGVHDAVRTLGGSFAEAN